MRATNVTVVNLIDQAYNLKHTQLADGPGWIGPGKLNITCIYAQNLLRRLVELAQASGGTLV